jgi:hypothetical protein
VCCFPSVVSLAVRIPISETCWPGSALEDIEGTVPLTPRLQYFEAKYVYQSATGSDWKQDALADPQTGLRTFGGFNHDENFAKSVPGRAFAKF